MIEKKAFGKTAAGKEVNLFTLRNANGLSAEFLDYGCVIRAVNVPNAKGELMDVALGYDTLAEYEADDTYQGALVGRCANRISGAEFKLNGRTFQLAANNGRNHLHGGPGGFHCQVWQAETEGEKLILTRRSPDGEEGYPGNLDVRVTYQLTDNNELIMDYKAKGDSDTIVNLTNHIYFNLAGGGDVLGHAVTLAADLFSEVNAELIPTGRLLSVENTPFDFRKAKTLGRDIGANDAQLLCGNGYDHNYALRPDQGSGPFAAVEAGGIRLEAFTTQPGVQLYSGNFLTTTPGKGGKNIIHRGGFCLETQIFPDAINKQPPEKIVLKRGALYEQSTTYKFSVC